MVRQTDRQTDRQTHTHTHTHTHRHFFLKHIFRLWEWCRTKDHKKKSKSNFLTIAILPSLLMSLESEKGSRYLHEDPIYRIWTRLVNWFRLYVRRRSHRQTDKQTDGQTHIHTHRHFFLKHIFRLWERCRIKNHKNSEVEFFDDCNTSFTPNVARK